MLMTLLNRVMTCGCISPPLGSGVGVGVMRFDLWITLSAAVAAGSTGLAVYLADSGHTMEMSSTTPMSVLSSLFAFLLTFRNKESYERWFEGRSRFA